MGDEYDWSEFDALKATSFAAAREPVFHYVISAHGYGSSTELSTGLSRDIEASDLIVSLGAGCGATGADCTYTQPEQAGSLMHELGQNLGLHHGGGDDDNYKPNYLSIMNYAFTLGGLRSSVDPPRFDYSRHVIWLDERALNETTGFGVPAGAPATRLFTVGFCPGADPNLGPNTAWNLTGAADFDCDTNFGTITADVNLDGATTVLAPYEDWGNLVYDGGLLGLGAAPLPDRTESDEAGSELLAARDALDSLAPPAPAATPTPAPTPEPPAPSTPPPPSSGSGLRAPPALSGLRVRPAAFRPTRRARRGAHVSYTLSEAGRIRFGVERRIAGQGARARPLRARRDAARGRRPGGHAAPRAVPDRALRAATLPGSCPG